MKIIKEIPDWFKLENYNRAESFTACEWHGEINKRLNYSIHTIEFIKKYTFFSNKESAHLWREDLDMGIKENKDKAIYFLTSNAVCIRERRELTENERNEYQVIEKPVDAYENLKFLEIDMDASNDQIIKQFKKWLEIARKTQNAEFLKSEFTSTDFNDWHESRILPFWDLINISAFENLNIPSHVLA